MGWSMILKMFDSLKNWWALCRGEHAILTLIAVAIGALISTKSPSISLLVIGVGPALITLASFVINDLLDMPTDKANKRTDRPLVSGKVSKNSALMATVVLYIAGLIF